LEKQFYEEIEAKDQAEAVRIARRRAGYLYLEESGIVACQRDLVATLENGTHVSVALVFSLTGKGVKWIRYLRESDRLAAFA
jgi:hypothetical protein